MSNTSYRMKGIVMIISGAMFWGATVLMMEWVLFHSDLTVPFMLTIRLIFAGLLLLAYLSSLKDVLTIWKYSVWWKKLLLLTCLVCQMFNIRL